MTRGQDSVSSREGMFWDIGEGRIPLPESAATLGFEMVDVDPEEGTIEVSFVASEAFVNPVGYVQGGFLAAMLDETVGPALMSTLGPNQFAPTLEFKVNFLRPTRPGRLTGRGRVVHRGGSVAFLEGSIVDAEGALIATSTATAKIISMDPDEKSG